MVTSLTGHKIKRFPYRHHNSEIKVDSMVLALGTSNGLHNIWHIRLGSLVKLHIGMDRKGVAALQTRALPFAVGLHAATVNTESVGLTNCALHGAQTRFHLLYRHMSHRFRGFGFGSRCLHRPSIQTANGILQL